MDSPVIFQWLVFLFVACSLLAWNAFLRRARSGRPVLEYELRQAVPWNGSDLVTVFVITLVIQSLTAAIVRMVSSELATSERDLSPEEIRQLLLASAIANSAALIAALGYLRLRAGATFRDLGFERSKILADIKIGVVAFFVVVLPIYLLQGLLSLWFEPQHPLLSLLQEQPDWKTWAVCAVSAAVIAPVTEEMTFRVMLQGWLERLPKTWMSPQHRGSEIAEQHGLDSPAVDLVPIGLSAALFALMHLGHGPAPIPLFFLATALGYVYQRTHRILPCIVIHAMLNGTSLLMLAIAPDQVTP